MQNGILLRIMLHLLLPILCVTNQIMYILKGVVHLNYNEKIEYIVNGIKKELCGN